MHARRHSPAWQPRSWCRGHRRQDDRGRSRCHGEGGHSRPPPESRHIRHHRSRGSATAFRERCGARAKTRNWHIQFNTQPSIIEALSPQLLASPVPLVIDHFSGANAARGVEQPGFGALVNLVKSGKAYVKISGSADSVSTREDLADVAPLARALVAANPQRILWGTNWPHPGSSAVPGRKPTDLALHVQTDDGKVLNMLPVWVPGRRHTQTHSRRQPRASVRLLIDAAGPHHFHGVVSCPAVGRQSHRRTASFYMWPEMLEFTGVCAGRILELSTANHGRSQTP